MGLSRPISRVLFEVITSLVIIYLSDLPEGDVKRATSPLSLGLAPGRVYPTTLLPGIGVSSYLTISPLPCTIRCADTVYGGIVSVALSRGSPLASFEVITSSRLPCPMVPGLSSPHHMVRGDHPVYLSAGVMVSMNFKISSIYHSCS